MSIELNALKSIAALSTDEGARNVARRALAKMKALASPTPSGEAEELAKALEQIVFLFSEYHEAKSIATKALAKYKYPTLTNQIKTIEFSDEDESIPPVQETVQQAKINDLVEDVESRLELYPDDSILKQMLVKIRGLSVQEGEAVEFVRWLDDNRDNAKPDWQKILDILHRDNRVFESIYALFKQRPIVKEDTQDELFDELVTRLHNSYNEVELALLKTQYKIIRK